jgi:predicted small lipoprotein YifL
MRKVLSFIAVVAVMLSATACGSNNSKEIDTLS